MPTINTVINVTSAAAEESLRRLRVAFNDLRDVATSTGTRIGKAFNYAWDRAKRFINGFRSGFRKVRSIFQGLISTIGNFIGIASFEELIRSTQSVVASFISVNNALITITGSNYSAGKSMDFLKGKSQELGTDLTVLTESYLKFVAAGSKSKLTSAELHDVFTAMAETSVILQFSTQQTEGAFRALTQMMSKGRVQAEELRGQLGEHLPGAFEIAAQSMSLTTKELDEMLKQGLITADFLLGKFAAGLRAEYGSALPGAIRTSTAEFGKLKNEILIFFEENKTKFDNAFSNVARALKDAFRQMQSAGWIDWLTSSDLGLKTITDYLKNLPKHLSMIYLTAKHGLKIYWLEAKKLFLELKSFMPGKTGEDAAQALQGRVPVQQVQTRTLPFSGWRGLLGMDQTEQVIAEIYEFKTMSIDEQIKRARKESEAEIEAMVKAFQKGGKSYVGSPYSVFKTGADDEEPTRQEKRYKIFSAELGKVNREFEEGKTSLVQYNEALANVLRKFDDMGTQGQEMFYGFKLGAAEFASEAGGAVSEWADLTTSAFNGVTDAFVEGLAEGRTSFSDFTNSILKDLLRILIRLNIVLPIARQLSSVLSTGDVSAVVGRIGSIGFSPSSSDFNVGSSGSLDSGVVNPTYTSPTYDLTPYASGGIVTKPTAALIGEGGTPEAVIPLTQLSKYIGSGGGTVVNITNTSSAEVTQEETTGPDGEEMIQVMIEDKISKMVQTGKFDRVLSPYNVSRKGYR